VALSDQEELEMLRLRKQKATQSQEPKEPTIGEKAGAGLYGAATGLVGGTGEFEKFVADDIPEYLGFRDKEETLDVLGKGLEKIDKMQNPDAKHLDDLLDKVAEYGIDSLTDREKEDLEKHSKKESRHIKGFKQL